MKYKSINFITNHLSEIINKDADLIIKNICEDYSLDYKSIKKNILIMIQLIIILKIC